MSTSMEVVINKLRAKFKKVKQEMDHWNELQSQLVLQFSNASSIIARLQVLQNSENYGNLSCINHIEDAVLAKQLESLDKIVTSMKKTVEGFRGIVISLDKVQRDGKQFVTGCSSRLSGKQQHIGVKPSVSNCLASLALLHDMHLSECNLKLSLISALSALALKPSPSDLGALQQLLIDQPNIPVGEVEHVYDIIFAEEIC